MHWAFYTELARQRNELKDQLIQALLGSCLADYHFQHWQRAVKYRYGLHPLCTAGSYTGIGQRFNTGEGVNSEIPSFRALYLAQDKDTALQEHLGQQDSIVKTTLTPRELALTNPSSETIVSISGHLERVFDLTHPKNLSDFVDLIKGFRFSAHIKNRARQLGVPANYISIIKTPQVLHAALLDPHWRSIPASYDVPANSQIFGHLIEAAGIEGILYSSKFTKKPCLALFPKNFAHTDSFIQLDDLPPHPEVPTRIDAKTWRVTELSFDELIARGEMH